MKFRNYLSCSYPVLSRKLFCELRHPVKIPMLPSSAGDHVHLNFCPFYLLHMSLSC